MAVLENAVASTKAGAFPAGNETRNEALIKDFIESWDRQDTSGVFAAFSPDIIYGNGPLNDIIGAEALEEYFEPILKSAKKIEFRVSRLVAAGAIVSVERVDYITLGDKTYTVPVAGFLTINNVGKISEWRDYFDVQSWYVQGGPPLESAADKNQPPVVSNKIN